MRTVVLCLLLCLRLAAQDPPGGKCHAPVKPEHVVSNWSGVASGDVCPTLPTHDVVDGAEGESEICRQRFAGSARRLVAGSFPFGVSGSYLPDQFIGQRGPSVSFAPVVRAVDELVPHVLGLCPPLKIFKPVVRSVAVGEVPAHHARRAGADEGGQYQLVSSGLIPVAPAGDVVSRIPARVQDGLHAPPLVGEYADAPLADASLYPLAAGPHAPVITDPVAGESGEVFVGDRRIVLRHDRLLIRGGCVQGGSAGDNCRLARLNSTAPINPNDDSCDAPLVGGTSSGGVA